MFLSLRHGYAVPPPSSERGRVLCLLKPITKYFFTFSFTEMYIGFFKARVVIEIYVDGRPIRCRAAVVDVS